MIDTLQSKCTINTNRWKTTGETDPTFVPSSHSANFPFSQVHEMHVRPLSASSASLLQQLSDHQSVNSCSKSNDNGFPYVSVFTSFSTSVNWLSILTWLRPQFVNKLSVPYLALVGHSVVSLPPHGLGRHFKQIQILLHRLDYCIWPSQSAHRGCH